MPVKNRFAELSDEITAWRRDFHTHPELRFEETRTAGLVADRLKAFGCDEIVEGFGKTGVVAVIRGRKNGSGRTIGFRADMDALPIEEATGLPYASENPGKMHACGHDGHTSMLLGAARYLAETRNFDGTVVLCFQPAEEGGGGAKAMLDDGLMERFSIDEIYGMHNWPGIEAGQFAVLEGPQMSAAQAFTITVKGTGGHGAMPHLTVDTSLVASHIVVAMQSVVARAVNPLKSAVISLCGLRSDTDIFNVIPDTVTIKGTLRYFNKDVRVVIGERMDAIIKHTAEAYGARASLEFLGDGVPPTVNDVQAARYATAAAKAVTGRETVDIDPVMPAEDFSQMLEARPGAYVFIGNGDSADLHNPHYNFNDDILPVGCSFFAELAESRMPIAD
ncbi:M20 aminoacylase family protein [Lentibacter sp. XHP0401]|uniref:M20 aminoacylase family protein n=1 Tax=Lentibacter sp. XHP0401 TaxID=2984334 RepID=UPI0021E8D378|nr:M20 aminoacylase family protein [Lentibacter sp. XHP0401]MCV2893975.1 M20 family metallopeptidase [Lentibacter sp. XHP0401]